MLPRVENVLVHMGEVEAVEVKEHDWNLDDLGFYICPTESKKDNSNNANLNIVYRGITPLHPHKQRCH